MIYLWVMLGGAVGTGARFALGRFADDRGGPTAAMWTTLCINVTGSFLISYFAGLTEPGGRWAAAGPLRLFFMVGICGGYTTFSAFSYQTVVLLRAGERGAALLNIAASLIFCLAAAWIGILAAAATNRT